MSDDLPTYLESNKPEAERCVELASAAWKSGDLNKAHRMLAKSLKLYPTREAQQLIQQLTAHIQQQQQHQQQQERQQQERQRQQQQQQQQQQQSSNGAYQRPNASHSTPSKPAASTNSSSASTNASPPPSGDSEGAKRILRLRKDYYAMFSVSRTATDQEIKKSYRKLALTFHPDKNKAPEAEEAFKVIGNAFQVLSDPQKRAHYDAYGEDEPNGGGGGGGMRYQRQYQREEDLSPEDVFNMFFNGGMGVGGGMPRRTYTYRRQARPQYQGGQGGDESIGSIFSQFAHFLPLILLLLFGLMSAPGGDEQVFGLEKSATFPFARSTAHAKVDYFVNNQFQYRYNRDHRALQQLEAMVEAQAFKKAEDDCIRQKKSLSEDERRVKKESKGADLAAKLQALQNRPLEACARLKRFQTNAHGAARGA